MITEETLRDLLLDLQTAIQGNVQSQQATPTQERLSGLHSVTKADAIYQIDKVSEKFVLQWFARNWPQDLPVELMMEGIEDGSMTFPENLPTHKTDYLCIIDPIDGTRCIMDDKRSAWVLSAIAPRTSPSTPPTLKDIRVAAMTELPPTKQRLADQISGIKGMGRSGLRSTRVNMDTGQQKAIKLEPSRATDLKHGHGIVAKFFPEAKGLLTSFEEELIDRLYGLGNTPYPIVFDDQYPSTGGQFYEILAGRDRMTLDLRPLALNKAGYSNCLAAHPYDVCTALLLEESGCPVSGMLGEPLDSPLDTTSCVGFLAFANHRLQQQISPLVAELVKKWLL